MSHRLKVAYVLGTFPQLTQTFVIREIYWIRDHDIDTHIFSLSMPKSTQVHEQAKTLQDLVHYSPYLSWEVIKAQLYFVHRLPYRYLRAFVKMVWLTYREPKMLLQSLRIFPQSVYFARKMEEADIDHIHAHFLMLAAIAATVASDLLGITFSLHCHAVGLFKRNSKDVQHQLECASQIVAISSYHRAYIARLCPDRKPDEIEVVYCGLETDSYQPILKETQDSCVQILSVGRLIEKKGFEYLIDACSVLAKSDLSFQCHIVGDGPLEAELQARINRHGLTGQVTLLGALKPAEVRDLYQTCHIFVLPCVVAADGNRDGLPVVLVEAMSCEVPVITTPVTGIVDLVEHGKTGLLVRERDVSELGDTIKKLIEDGEMRKLLGRQGRQKVLEDFQVQGTTRQLAEIFRKVVSNANESMPGQ